jgi:hypothetical protein
MGASRASADHACEGRRCSVRLHTFESSAGGSPWERVAGLALSTILRCLGNRARGRSVAPSHSVGRARRRDRAPSGAFERRAAQAIASPFTRSAWAKSHSQCLLAQRTCDRCPGARLVCATRRSARPPPARCHVRNRIRSRCWDFIASARLAHAERRHRRLSARHLLDGAGTCMPVRIEAPGRHPRARADFN